MRDIITYIVASTFFLVAGFYDVEYWFIATVLISIYIVYVFIVWLEERNKVSTIAQTKHILDENTIKVNLIAPIEHEEIDDDDDNLSSKLTFDDDKNHSPTNKFTLGDDTMAEKMTYGTNKGSLGIDSHQENNQFRILLTKPSTEDMPEVVAGGDHDKNHLAVPGGHLEQIKYKHDGDEEFDRKARLKRSSIMLEGSVIIFFNFYFKDFIG